MIPLKFNHISNCRDLGGTKTTDGKIIRENIFIRGVTLKNLSKSEIKLLKEKYHLSTVIDIRCYKEIKEKPNQKISGVTYFDMPLSTETVLGISHEKRVGTLKTLDLMPEMPKLYSELVQGECLENLKKILKKILTLKDDEYSVYFHCSAGKDRTGIVTALILYLLGVDKKTIMDDYLYSNKAHWVKAFFVYFGIFVLKWNHKFAKKIRQSLQAKEEFLLSAMNTLEKRFGSIDNFYTQGLGFSLEEIEKIKNRFLI